jgi:hypothetical protein
LATGGFEQVPVAVLHVPAAWHWSLAAQVTGFEPVQAPAWHESAWVQALPSLHEAPSAFAGLVHAPVVVSQVPAVWHWSGAAQVTGLAPVQAPAWHVSAWVQALPSLHEEPLAFAGFEQTPVALLHVPAVWHWSAAAQVTGLAPVQVPAWHESVCVQALPSSHDAPSAFAGFEQTPVALLHVPAVWHWSAAAQVTGLLPVQAPAWHVSVCVQELPSLHDAPSAFAGFEHTPVLVLHVPAE